MLLSISLILIVGMFMGWLCQKCRLPSLLGMAVGLAVGFLLAYFFAKVHIRDTAKVLIILSISFLLVAAEDALTTAITFSALIAIMFIGHPAGTGLCLWRYRAYRGGAGHRADGSPWCLCHGFEL